MEALIASYGSDSDEEEEEEEVTRLPVPETKEVVGPLPPPPVDLLQPPNFVDVSATQGIRVRNFPHVQGNYALHVFVPVHIPTIVRKQLAVHVKRIASLVPSLYVVDVDIALSEICKDEQKLEQILLAREFHISLGRTVPIQVHQIDSVVAMLRERLQSQRGYLIEFNKWDAFVNDDLTRSFLSLEVTGGGLTQISRQIQIVDEVYRLHGLPEFYKNPRPHISLAWALGDISDTLKNAVSGLRLQNKHIFMCKFSGIECKIGKKSFNVCRYISQ